MWQVSPKQLAEACGALTRCDEATVDTPSEWQPVWRTCPMCIKMQKAYQVYQVAFSCCEDLDRPGSGWWQNEWKEPKELKKKEITCVSFSGFDRFCIFYINTRQGMLETRITMTYYYVRVAMEIKNCFIDVHSTVYHYIYIYMYRYCITNILLTFILLNASTRRVASIQ